LICGLILGIAAERQYEERPVQISPGDVMVMYTDGVTDTENENGEQFGIDRLVEIVRENRRAKAAEIRTRLVDAIAEFAAPDFQPDDLTLVVIKFH
jgi:sigma-B regulation protein RsbU (phosphoserine phosphatase)